MSLAEQEISLAFSLTLTFWYDWIYCRNWIRPNFGTSGGYGMRPIPLQIWFLVCLYRVYCWF